MSKKQETQLDLLEVPEPEKKTAPVVGHGDTQADPRRRHAGVERRERQKHAREMRKKHGAAE